MLTKVLRSTELISNPQRLFILIDFNIILIYAKIFQLTSYLIILRNFSNVSLLFVLNVCRTVTHMY